jgi:AcrR family transcriptional regulator
MADLRADARRNRDELLDVARLVIAEEGVDASLRDIARRAGVGIGTLYRHFPTREALLAAIIQDGTRRMGLHAAELSATEAPGPALDLWLTDVARRIGPYRGLPDSIVKAASVDQDGDPALRACSTDLLQAGRGLLTRAQAAGAVRPDVTWDDVFAAVAAISGIVSGSGKEVATRALAVYLDGLRTGTGSAAAVS